MSLCGFLCKLSRHRVQLSSLSGSNKHLELPGAATPPAGVQTSSKDRGVTRTFWRMMQKKKRNYVNNDYRSSVLATWRGAPLNPTSVIY